MEHRTIEQQLAAEQRGFFRTSGTSMEPLLHHHRSTVVIESNPNHGRLKLYDVALFRRSSGEYVLHRVVKVLKDGYLILGDNSVWREPVSEDQILGVMVGYYPDEQNNYISCSDSIYQEYLKRLILRYRLQRLRALPARICRRLKKIFRK